MANLYGNPLEIREVQPKWHTAPNPISSLYIIYNLPWTVNRKILSPIVLYVGKMLKKRKKSNKMEAND
jgi:hypothetical protein